MTLRGSLIRLAHEKPELRERLLPFLKDAAKEKKRWFEQYEIGQRVEIRTSLNGREIWRPGRVTELPRITTSRFQIPGHFRVQRDPLPGQTHGGEVEATRGQDVRPVGTKTATNDHELLSFVQKGHRVGIYDVADKFFKGDVAKADAALRHLEPKVRGHGAQASLGRTHTYLQWEYVGATKDAAEDEKLSPEKVRHLPVGSLLFSWRNGRPDQGWVVVPGGLAPTSLLSERAGGPEPEGEAPATLGEEFSVLSKGKGKMPAGSSAKRSEIEWFRKQRSAKTATSESIAWLPAKNEDEAEWQEMMDTKAKKGRLTDADRKKIESRGGKFEKRADASSVASKYLNRKAGPSRSQLNAFHKQQEEKALKMVQDGKSETEVLAVLGGIGLGELRVNYPKVHQALQIALSNYRRRDN